MKASPYLYFNGNCREAFEFYANCLDAEIAGMITYGEAPPDPAFSEDWSDKVLHARLTLEGGAIMGTDAPPPDFEEPRGFSVHLSMDTAADAERVYAALAQDAVFAMPLEETFLASRFAMVKDRFGTRWEIECEKPMPWTRSADTASGL